MGKNQVVQEYKHSPLCTEQIHLHSILVMLYLDVLIGALGWTEPHNRNSSAMVFQIARSVSSGSTLHAAAQQQLNAGVHGP